MKKHLTRCTSVLLITTVLLSLLSCFPVFAAGELENLYDNSVAVCGTPSASGKDIALSYNANYYTSDVISVKPGDVVTFGPCLVDQGYFLMSYNSSGTGGTQIKYANCQKVDTVISNAEILKWTVPEGVSYIRMTTSQMFVESTVITVNREFNKEDYFSAMDKANINVDYVRPTSSKETLTNLFPRSDKTYNGRIDAKNAEIASDSYRTSDYIPVKEGDVIYFGAAVSSQGYHLALQDENKNGTTTVNYKYMVMYEDIGRGYAIYSYRIRPGTAYVRVVAATGVYDDEIQLVTKNQPFTGEDYRKLFNITVSDNSSSESPLKGLNALFMGDSISYGAGDTLSYLRSGRAWAGRIADITGLNATNASVSGAKASYISGDDESKWLFNQYKAHSGEKYDLIVMQGGVNDARHIRQVGKVSESTSESDLVANIGTYAGGLQWLFYNVKEVFPDAKLFFIANHRLDGHATGKARDMSEYFNVAKQLCEMYDIVFIDLYNNKELNDKLETSTTKYLPDTLHLNAAGYDIITPYIVSALEAEYKTEEPVTDDETTANVTTNAPTTTETPQTEKPQGGCGSLVCGGGAVAFITVLAAVQTTLLKKKQD